MNVRGYGSWQIKQHISGHFFEDWVKFAARHIDDTSLTESTHKLVKNRWRSGSKRTLEASSEMYDRFQCQKVMEHAYAKFETKFGSDVSQYTKRVYKQNPKTVYYQTENDIDFSTTGYKNDSQALIFSRSGKLRIRGRRNTLRFCITLLSLQQITEFLDGAPALTSFMADLRAKADGVCTIN